MPGVRPGALLGHTPGLWTPPSSAAAVAFTPSSIAGLQAWYKADAGTSTTTDGVAISQWNDQSGNARHLTQATGANQPLYKAAIQNALPGVLFDGVNDQLAATAVSVAQPDTIFAVVKNLQVIPGTVNGIFDGATTRQSVYRQTDDTLRATAGTDTGSTFTFGTANAHQMSLIVNGASTALWMNASSVALGNIGTATLASLIIGQNFLASAPWNGYIFEWLIYNSSLSTTNRQSVEAYLKSKWGTP